MQLGLCSWGSLIAWQMIPLGSRSGNALLPLSSLVPNLSLPDISPLRNKGWPQPCPLLSLPQEEDIDCWRARRIKEDMVRVGIVSTLGRGSYWIAMNRAQGKWGRMKEKRGKRKEELLLYTALWSLMISPPPALCTFNSHISAFLTGTHLTPHYSPSPYWPLIRATTLGFYLCD